MNILKPNFLFATLLLCTLTLFSCAKKDPIKIGANVTVTNTFQGTNFTGGLEKPIEELFSAPAGSLAASSTVSESVEFSKYLLGLYDINLDETSIKFEVVAAANDATYSSLFRVLEAGTTDRYYFTFDEEQNVSGFTSNNPAVKLRIDSEKVLVVEIGEGYDFKPGTSFTITLN